MRRNCRLIMILMMTGMALTSVAKEAPLSATDPVTEQKMLDIATGLRCLVCQNQTVADSHSELAGDLRQEIREMVKKGQSTEEVTAYMTARYGDFILYRPPVNIKTWLLWFGPPVLLLLGLWGLFHTLAKRNRMIETEQVPLTDDEEEDE